MEVGDGCMEVHYSIYFCGYLNFSIIIKILINILLKNNHLECPFKSQISGLPHSKLLNPNGKREPRHVRF